MSSHFIGWVDFARAFHLPVDTTACTEQDLEQYADGLDEQSRNLACSTDEQDTCRAVAKALRQEVTDRLERAVNGPTATDH